jgi:hypothetical protein
MRRVVVATSPHQQVFVSRSASSTSRSHLNA